MPFSNLGINLLNTGDQPGTWGVTTNNNFEIFDAAINGYVNIVVTSNGSDTSPNTITISDSPLSGSTDPRRKIIEFTGSPPAGLVYYRIDPNDFVGYWFIRNSCGRTIALFQGSFDPARDVEIPAGADIIVRCNGGGVTATVVPIFNNLNVSKLIGLSNGTALTDSISLGQFQSGAATWLTSIGGTANAVTATATPTPTSYTAGQEFKFVPLSTNTGATTLQITGVTGGAQQIFSAGTACVGGELVAGVPATVVYDGTRFHLINPVRSSLRQTAFQLAGTATPTTITHNTITRLNLTSGWDPGGNITSNYYVVPQTGIYFFGGLYQLDYSASITSTHNLIIAIQIADNAGIALSTSNLSANLVFPVTISVGSFPVIVSGSGIISATAGQRIYGTLYQSSGISRTAPAFGGQFFGWRVG